MPYLNTCGNFIDCIALALQFLTGPAPARMEPTIVYQTVEKTVYQTETAEQREYRLASAAEKARIDATNKCSAKVSELIREYQGREDRINAMVRAYYLTQAAGTSLFNDHWDIQQRWNYEVKMANSETQIALVRECSPYWSAQQISALGAWDKALRDHTRYFTK